LKHLGLKDEVLHNEEEHTNLNRVLSLNLQ